MLRIFDSAVAELGKPNFNDIRNPMWVSIMTMTTVGYGEMSPQTMPAKIIGILCTFYGAYIVSLFIISTEAVFVMEPAHIRAYTLLERLECKEKIRKAAVDVLNNSYKYRK